MFAGTGCLLFELRWNVVELVSLNMESRFCRLHLQKGLLKGQYKFLA